ncbi:MAG: molybdopterin molybdotransferase MoeA [Candidatus Accumulibacter sp.]|jgi:molybdopterin molybdotransferase|uniref:molybdopterin molybdotransferase MoeA n=1 Tax=Candidatus Accumulibacter necessarius TaxID=2954386 RepID=UPI001AC67019|nr:molybdopterin molybdotransferase MoeA [Candidatus Accumulibacter necessarius]
MLTFDEALSRLLDGAQTVSEVRSLPTLAAAGRVLARAQAAAVDAPPLDNSAMDGYALAVADVPQLASCLPVSQRIVAGSVGTRLQPGTTARIFTGAPIPAGADAVVMQELCQHAADSVLINHLPRVGEHIRRAGSDIAAGSEILSVGLRLRPQDTAQAGSVGIADLPVFRRLRVAVLFTGDELRMPGEALPPGAIYNANRFLLCPLLERLGCVVRDLGQVADDLAATRRALREAAHDNDLVLSSGGVSVGEEDHVKAAVELEGRLEMWKIAIKPGKPLAFGHLTSPGREVPLIGLPGNPVSCLVTFLMLVRPLLLKMQGVREVSPPAYLLRADFDWLRPDARREFLRARSNGDGGVDLFPNQASGVLSSAVWADGLVDNPPQQVIHRGDRVRFLPFSALLN